MTGVQTCALPIYSEAIVYIDTTYTPTSVTVTFFGNNGGITCGTERGERSGFTSASVIYRADEDGTVGTHPVAVISHRLWRSHFGSDRAVVGRSVAINRRSVVIVGVADERFRGIETEEVDIWVPLAMATPLGLMDDQGGDWRTNLFTTVLRFVGRLTTTGLIRTVATQSAEALARSAPPELDPTPRVLVSSLIVGSGPNRPAAADLALWVFAVTGIVLAMTSSNLANLSLARSISRRREMASRLALGASPGRLVRQVLAESLVLTFLGTAAGLLLAFWGSLIAGQFPLPPGADELNAQLLGFASLVALFSGAVPALVSAMSVVRADPVRWLKESRSMAGPGHQRMRSGLLVVQVALSAVLLIGAGLFVRSLDRVVSVESGLDIERIFVVSMDLVRAGYEPPDREAIYEAARERLVQIHGVQRVSTSIFAPLGELRYRTGIGVAGQASITIDESPHVNWVGGGYFETVGAIMLRGRGIQEEDRSGSPPVVVVNQALARLLAPDGEATGICLAIKSQLRGGDCAMVVGVVQDHRSSYLDPDIPPILYLARDQHPEPASFVDAYLLVRARQDAGAIAEQVREAMRTVRSDLPFVAVESLEDRLRPELVPFRLGAVLFSVFGALALAVVALGVYSIVSYVVSLRVSELAIRQSLGATSGDVVRLVIRQTMVPVGAGIIIGMAVGYLGGSLIEALLFGVSARDPLVFAGAAAFLGAVSLLASYVPARRGATMDPMATLRAE